MSTTAYRPATRVGRGPVSALSRKIPDDPNYQRYIPLEYRLNAKAIVGELAQDLHKGQSAHVWVEIGEPAIGTAEVIAETSLLIGGLSIAGPFLAMAANFLMLGAGYQEAAEKIATNWAASGYSRGVVLGANRRPAAQVKKYYGNLYFPPNVAFERGRGIARANHHAGLVAGYLSGRILKPNQHVIFWRDLGRRMGDQSWRGPRERWTSQQTQDWYTEAAAVFRRDHLNA
jgi:hypothetical protein